jgi:hypothetical protein
MLAHLDATSGSLIVQAILAGTAGAVVLSTSPCTAPWTGGTCRPASR